MRKNYKKLISYAFYIASLTLGFFAFAQSFTQADIKQVTDLVGGIATGFVPTPKIVKIEVQTKTAQELNNKIQTIKNLSSPLILEVVQNLVAQ